MRKALLLCTTGFMLSGCYQGTLDLVTPAFPQSWTAEKPENIEPAYTQDLQNWWQKFDDPALNGLVAMGLADSPDRLMAEARIAEARGMKRSSRSTLFPQIGASGSYGYEDTQAQGASENEFYDAQFDASYEIDIFGKNRSAYSAADKQLRAAEAEYHDMSLSLIAEITRTYIDYRAAQNQTRIARKNLESQEKTLELINTLFELGEGPKLDVERAATLVNTTRASIPEFERLAENAKLRLSVLTGALPEKITPLLLPEAPIPGALLKPVLMAPAKVLVMRPDIQAASANLAANTALAESATAEIFPNFTLSGFYGIADSALIDSATPWRIAINAAVSLIDFGRIEGRIDAARAREKQAYELYRKTVLEAVTEVETALNDYTKINERLIALESAYKNANKSLELSEILFKEGEVAFLDVLDAQRSANEAEAAVISARAAKAESLTRLYKSLGIY